MLRDEYDVMEAMDGQRALAAARQHKQAISLILLGFEAPSLDGLRILRNLASSTLLDTIPVAMLTTEPSLVPLAKAYELGAEDHIDSFEPPVVLRHVRNLIELADARREGMTRAAARRHNERLLVSFLAHLVEFRNSESGEHVLHIGVLTELLLRTLVTMRPDNPWGLTEEYIDLISTAAALHDIGKIAIDEKILNKPSSLTIAEFEIMKTHTLRGAEIIDRLADREAEPLLNVAHEICRSHHERYDGRGYPDGLRGDEIPISAQVVAIADVYDALTSERVYKKARPHEEAVRMILDGECGAFNPLLLDCLREVCAGIEPGAINPFFPTTVARGPATC